MLKLQLPLAFFRFVVITFFSLTAYTAFASPVDIHEFSDEVTQKRYNSLVKELRCPKCQNQNLADSNSPIAKDLRQEVYELLHLDKSDGEIVDYMVKRYGEFVLYRPRVSSVTYILWFAPIGLIVLGVGVVVVLVRRKTPREENAELSDEQQQALESILKKGK